MPRTQLPKDTENALTPFPLTVHQDSLGPLVLLLGITGRLLGNVSHVFKNKSTPRLQVISSYILSLAELLCYKKNNTHVTPFMLMEAWQFCFLTCIDIACAQGCYQPGHMCKDQGPVLQVSSCA